MNLVLFTCWRWRHGSCSYPALTIAYSLPCTTGLQWLHYRPCSCWMLTMLVSCLHCCLCTTTTYIALLVFCDLCSALLCLPIAIVLLVFYGLCSTLLCRLCLYSFIYVLHCSACLLLSNVLHRSACLCSNWHLWPLSLLALSTTYPDHRGRHRLKHNALPLKTHLNPPLKTHLNTSLKTHHCAL